MRLEPQSATPLPVPTALADGVAGLLAMICLLVARAPWPRREHGPMLMLTVFGNVLGWPLLLGLAVRRADAMHAAVITGLMPLATAAVGAVLLHQRPSRGFWGFALLGAALVVAFAAWSGAGLPQLGDLLLIGAVIASSVGYIRSGSGPTRRCGSRPGSASATWPCFRCGWASSPGTAACRLISFDVRIPLRGLSSPTARLTLKALP